MTTIRDRLGLRLLVSLVVVFALLWIATGLTVGKITRNYAASSIERDAEDVLAALDFSQNGNARINESRLSADYQRIFSGHYYLLQSGEQTLRSRSLWDYDFTVAATEGSSLVDGPRDQRLLVLVREYLKQGRPITITVAEDFAPILRDVRTFTVAFGIAALCALIALYLLQRAGIKAVLKPLAGVRSNIAHLEYGDIKTLNEDVPDEIQPLVHEINRLVRLQNERLRRSRNAIGNLAHALKGPLTELKHLIETLNHESLRNLYKQAGVQTAGTKVAKIHHLIERELKRARLAGEGSPGAVFEPGAELPQLIEAVRRHHPEKVLDIDLRMLSGERHFADREDMLELIGNLLDNACKWAVKTVRVTRANEPGLALFIEDDGPGVHAEHYELLTHRGVRLDENTEGHGLGLAIARDVVVQYRGTLSFARSEALGGFKAEIRLPLPGHL